MGSPLGRSMAIDLQLVALGVFRGIWGGLRVTHGQVDGHQPSTGCPGGRLERVLGGSWSHPWTGQWPSWGSSGLWTNSTCEPLVGTITISLPYVTYMKLHVDTWRCAIYVIFFLHPHAHLVQPNKHHARLLSPKKMIANINST